VRASRKMAEVRETAEIYKSRLIPAYQMRGWSIQPLNKQMRSKAIRFSDGIDSPRFTSNDRAEYIRLLMSFGNSFQLSSAIWLGEHGLNPLVRLWSRTRIRIKDRVKRLLRPVRST